MRGVGNIIKINITVLIFITAFLTGITYIIYYRFKKLKKHLNARIRRYQMHFYDSNHNGDV